MNDVDLLIVFLSVSMGLNFYQFYLHHQLMREVWHLDSLFERAMTLLGILIPDVEVEPDEG